MGERGRPLPIFLTADIGPALATLGTGHGADGDWQPTMAAVPLACDALARLEQKWDQAAPVTWFVRADALVRRQFGSTVAVLDSFSDAMGSDNLQSHEIGWMPQLPGAAGDMIDHQALYGAHEEMKRRLARIDSVRMGDCYHDNDSMRTLDELGVRFDCSAVPGRTKFDPGWHVDWRGTPSAPYHPSRADYRVPGFPHWNVVEVPMTVIPMQADYDAAPLLRYVNPCFHARYLWPGLQAVLPDADYLVCVFHPDEMLAGMSKGHPMVSYSVATFQENLSRLHSCAIAQGREPGFALLRDFPRVRVAG